MQSRSYVTSNPELCELLENPFLKDDTELAIRYNEYESGKPGAGEDFVDYFFTHGPELDIGTLEEWRDIIINDQELYQYGVNINLDAIWENKRNNQDENYSWLTDMFDCLARPCQYLDAISDAIGMSMGQMKELYKPENGITPWTSGCDMNVWTAPLNMFNKVPVAVQRLGINFGSGLADMWDNIMQCADTNWQKLSPDMHRVKHAESFGIDVLALIASQKGDCWRLINKNRRYQPYSVDQNKTGADRIGHMVYKNGRAIACNAAGYERKKPHSNLMSSNTGRLAPQGTARKIDQEVTKALSPVTSNKRLAKATLTWYSSILGTDGRLFTDNCTDGHLNDKGTSGTGSVGGRTSVTAEDRSKRAIIPMVLGKDYRLIDNDIATGKNWECCVALSDTLVNFYFDIVGVDSGFYFSAHDRPKLSQNFLTKARRESALRILFVLSNGQRFELPVYDRPSDSAGDVAAAISKTKATVMSEAVNMSQATISADITAQFFVTETGRSVSSLKWRSGDSAGSVATDLGTVSGPIVNAAQYSGKTIEKIGNLEKWLTFSLNGTNNRTCSCAIYLTDEFCANNSSELGDKLELYNRSGLAKDLLGDARKQLTSDDPDPTIQWTTKNVSTGINGDGNDTGLATMGNNPLATVTAQAAYNQSDGNASFQELYNNVAKLDYDNPVYYGGVQSDIETYYSNLYGREEAAKEAVKDMVSYDTLKQMFITPSGQQIKVNIKNDSRDKQTESNSSQFITLGEDLPTTVTDDMLKPLEASGEATVIPTKIPDISNSQAPGVQVGDIQNPVIVSNSKDNL